MFNSNKSNSSEKGVWGNITNYFAPSKPEPSLFDDIEAGDGSSLLGKIKNNFQETVEVETSYKSFFITLAIGLAFIFFSLLFLPFLALNPQKFLMLFSIGSFIIISSFIFIHGTSEYLKMLFNKERRIFSLVYIISIIAGFYSAYIQNNYILSLVSACAQFVMLIIFVLSFIPGGRAGISVILGLLMSPIRSLWKN
jgi:hypothetical protein